MKLERDRVVGCVLGALIGDVLGTKSEFLEPAEIEERYGWLSALEARPGSDDTILARLLCDALVTTRGMATSDDWAGTWLQERENSFVEHSDRFFPSVLYIVERLSRGDSPREVSAGSMPSTSSAMAMWPVGVVNAGRPGFAAAQAEELAGLIHTRDLGFCQDAAATVAATIAIGLICDDDPDALVRDALRYVKTTSGAEMRGLVVDALDLAAASTGYEDFRRDYHARFRRRIFCDSRETVPAAFALLALGGGDVRRSIEYAANFGRDTDTIASMVGAIAGASRGLTAIPADWVEEMGEAAVEEAAAVADQLIEVAGQKFAEPRH
jgi:ADP-ribosylglycohydrolase